MEKKPTMDVAACPVNASHETTACVPVKIKPFANPGKVSVECCGCPIIKIGEAECCGTLNGCCEFSISQKMKIDIPVTFGADIKVGETYVQCGRTEGESDGDGCICSCVDECCGDDDKKDKDCKDKEKDKDKHGYKSYKDYADLSKQFI